MSDAKLFSVDDAASILGAVSPWTLRKHIANRTIQVTRIGRRVLLPLDEVERIRREGLPSLRSQVSVGQIPESQIVGIALPDLADRGNHSKENKADEY
jgi:excisionase family DNA binding protein